VYRSHTLVTSQRGSACLSAARPALLGVTLSAAALLLSACAQPGGKSLAVDGKAAKAVAQGAMREAAPASVGVTATAPDSKAEIAASGAGAKMATPALIWHSADKLMGMAADELQAALGAPARIRDEESGRIYQYVGADCVLDLFLYQGAEGFYRVSYAEARSVHALAKPVDTCLKSLPAPIVADIAQPSS